MKIEDFQKLVWLLANQGHVRYWLHYDYSKLCLQFLNNELQPYEVDGMREKGFVWNPERQWHEIKRDRSNDWDDLDTYGPSA